MLLALLAAVLVTAAGCARAQAGDEYVLAVLIEGNRAEVTRAIDDEHGRVVLEVAETGTLRVAFDVHSTDELLAVQRRLRARGITAVVPGQGVPLSPSSGPPAGEVTPPRRAGHQKRSPSGSAMAGTTRVRTSG